MVEIITTKGDDGGTIDSLISHLEEAKKRGATHYNVMVNSFTSWFETYRYKSQKEIKQERIKALEKELQELKK